MKKELLASLIISTYKNTEFLKVVLNSVFAQSDMRFEIIISEDAEHEHVKVLWNNLNHQFRFTSLNRILAGARTLP